MRLYFVQGGKHGSPVSEVLGMDWFEIENVLIYTIGRVVLNYM